MSNGWMKKKANGSDWYGRVSTMKHDFEFLLNKISSTNPNAPAFEVLTKSPSGNYFKVGVVFEKRTKVKADEFGNKIGGDEPFYSFSIDDPSMGEPLYVTAFGAKDRPGEFDLVWQRPRQQKDAA